MISTVIADDHPIVRKGIAEILTEVADVHIVGEADSFESLITALDAGNPTLLVLDLNMPGMNGIETIKSLHTDYPALRILVMSMLPAEQFAAPCIHAGAAGYLDKRVASEELHHAVGVVMSGHIYLSPALHAALLRRDDSSHLPHQKLSSREFQILVMLGTGENAQAIATALDISPKTVHTYKRRIMDKLEFSTDREVFKYALEHKLV